MGAPSSTQRAETEALLRSVPKGVHAVGLLAALVGVFFLLRFCATAYADKLTFGKAILYGLLVLGLLVMNGFSLINKSRSGYVIVAIATLPSSRSMPTRTRSNCTFITAWSC